MYQSFYNLNAKPFQITSDPKFLWMGEKHSEALATLKYGILENKERFGYFVSLEPGITGLLPKSEIRKSPESARLERLKAGDTLTVTVNEINPEQRRITLGPGDSREEDDWKRFAKETRGPMSSLGEKLTQALKSKKADV